MNSGLSVARLPSLTNFEKGSNLRPDIRPIDVEDLLGRPPAKLENAAIERLIKGKRILVTGAGGSIGSELVRQLSDLSPSHISLIENSEYGLFKVDLELRKRHPTLSSNACIVDIRNLDRLTNVMKGKDLTSFFMLPHSNTCHC